MLFTKLSRKETLPAFVLKPAIAVTQYKLLSKNLDADIYYTIKSNPHPTLLRALKKINAKFSVTSQEHLSLLRKLRIPLSHILYTPPAGTKNVKGVTTIVSSLAQYEVAKPTTKFLFRVQPFVKPKANAFYAHCLGIPAKKLEKFLLKEKSKPYGLHMHVASQLTDFKCFEKNAKMFIRFAHKLKQQGIPIKVLNLGGGLPVPYQHQKVPSFKEMKKILKNIISEAKKQGFRIQIEPGRFIAAPSATLYSKVKLVEENTLTLDTSTYAAYLDTLIAQVYLPVVLLKKGKPVKKYTLRGNVGCSLDGFGEAKLPKTERGDVLAFFNAGAYALGTNLNGIKKPKVIVK